MTIGDDGIASICMGKEHTENPCKRCGHLDLTKPVTHNPAGMSDKQFLSYMEMHCQTPRRLFSRWQIARLCTLANTDFLFTVNREWDSFEPSFIDPLVATARKLHLDFEERPTNYKDEIKDLEDQIRLEFQRDNELSKKPAFKFDTSSDLLVFLSRLPINRNVELTSLSPFLRRFRRNANLDLQDVSIAVNVPANTIIQFESSDVLPWNLPASAMVALAYAYRIHIEAIDFLTRNSYQIARLSKKIADPTTEQSSMLNWLEDVHAEMNARGESTLTT